MREPFSKKMSEAALPASRAGGANKSFFMHYFLNFGWSDFSFNVFEKGLVCSSIPETTTYHMLTIVCRTKVSNRYTNIGNYERRYSIKIR